MKLIYRAQVIEYTVQKQRSLKQIAFIDTAVEDYQYLAASVYPNIETILLDPRRDGVIQITEELSDRTNIDSIHIISQGAEGCLKLGSTTLNIDNAVKYAIAVQQWRQSLGHEAEILLYGCNVADGKIGRAFVKWLNFLTGANLAASVNRTGHASLGGDWDLEYSTGKIQTSLAFPESVRESYSSILIFNPRDRISEKFPPPLSFNSCFASADEITTL
jgi:hypothetical protein